MIKLFPDQLEAKQGLASILGRGIRRVMVKAPTAFGKTVFSADLVLGALRKNKKVCFVVPSIMLVNQTVDRFLQFGVPFEAMGVIQAQHPMTDYSKPIQIASVDTLRRRDWNRLHFDMIMIDEAHEWREFYGEWMRAWSAIPFIGLSATPWSKGLGKHYQELLIAGFTDDLIAAKRLSPFKVFAPASPDLAGVRTVCGDYHEGQLSEAMQRGTLVADIVYTWQQMGENRPTLAFGVDRAHAAAIQQQFIAAGIDCGYIDAFTPDDERKETAERFNRGELRVVSNVGCLTKGIDWDVRCIIMARPTKSEMLFCQIVGRGLRLADGKDHCLVLDHSDTTIRLGFVTEVDRKHDQLCDGTHGTSSTPDYQEPLPQKCSQCGYMKPPKVHVCPNCAYKPEKVSNVEVEKGELVELEGADLSATQRKHNRNTTPEEKRQFYAELLGYCEAKSKKPGYAAHTYKDKFGVWPNKYRDAVPVSPSTETLSYIRSKNIRNAKRKAA